MRRRGQCGSLLVVAVFATLSLQMASSAVVATKLTKVVGAGT
jgi:hypothetical protein